MDLATKSGIVIGFLGIGIAIFALFAPYEWRDLPRWLRRSGLGLVLRQREVEG
jgi:hypothetical protein